MCESPSSFKRCTTSQYHNHLLKRTYQNTIFLSFLLIKMRILQLLCLTEMVVGYTVSPSNCQGCKKLLNAQYNNHSRRYNKLIRGCKSIE